MAASHDMKLAHFVVPEFFRPVNHLLGSKEKGTFLFSTSLAICAKPAPVGTNIGIIDVKVIYVKDPAVVFRLINLIGQAAQSEQVIGFEQRDPIIPVQSASVRQTFGYLSQPGIEKIP